MPIGAIIGASVVGAGATVYASSKASKAATQASDQNAQIQQKIYDQTRSDLQPYTQSGYAANSALVNRLGLGGPAQGGATQSAGAQRPGPQIAPYMGPGAQPQTQAAGGGGGMFGTHTAGSMAPMSGPVSAAGVNPGASTATTSAMPSPVVDPSYTGKTGFSLGTPPPGYEQYGGTGTPIASAAPAASAASAAPTAAAAPSATGGPLSQVQLQQIMQDRPDVAAEYQKAQANGSAQQRGLNSQDAYVADWYNRVRPAASDGYQLPASGAGTTPSAPAAPVPGQTLTSADNGGLGARQDPARQTITRPDFAQAQPTYTNPTFGPAPSQATYTDPNSFATSPGYQFRMDQGLRADNANYAARGLLKSDAAVKGLNDYAQGMASSEYGNWFNQQMQRYGADANQFNTDRSTTLNQFNTDRTTGLAQYNQNRNVFNQNYNTDTATYNQNFNTDTANYNANFNADRGYNTDQYNAYTGNLFNLTNMGQSAASGTANAGQNYAAAATANNNSRASVQGNAAIAGANGVNSAINSGMQAYGAYSNPFSVGTGSSFGAPASMAGLY